MRKPLIAGNWKMHGMLPQIKTLVEAIKQEAGQYSNIDILLLPTFIHLPAVHSLLTNSTLLLGAQNLYPGAQGAFTGEVSGAMLKEVGCDYVLIGHSERRTLFKEELALVAAKFKAAVESGLCPILCVGETREEREKGETSAILRQQLHSVIEVAGIELFRHAVIAYEPVWAIGTGLTATPEMAEEAHAYIRELIMQNNVDIAKTICILYGGSMKADNAASLLAMPNIDGGLIGGASLQAESFLKICADASQKVELMRAANS